MQYLPKHIHEKYQQFHYYELLNDFTMSVLDNARFIDLNNINDWDNLTYTIDLEVGDIICVRFFNESKYGGLATYYTYLDFYVRDDERFNINQETIISKDLIFKNTTIFDNITLQYNRDIKIENILGN
jgi:hypothetical protein